MRTNCNFLLQNLPSCVAELLHQNSKSPCQIQIALVSCVDRMDGRNSGPECVPGAAGGSGALREGNARLVRHTRLVQEAAASFSPTGGYNFYNPNACYLPILTNFLFHKLCFIKHLATGWERCNVFNARADTHDCSLFSASLQS